MKKTPRKDNRIPYQLLLVFLALGIGAGTAYSYATRRGITQSVGGYFHPESQFGAPQVNILVMGLDENWTRQDLSYTKGARTDTLFVLHLDIPNQKASLLSIPRDSRVPIAGTNREGKINSAYASGGPKRAIATVEAFLGVPMDHYIVLRLDTTKKLVDALDGVDVDVEKDMNYDDNWGHLHIHLKKGMQHLDGDQAVGYIRFRHDREGDFGRIRRQQQLLHAIVQRIKNPLVWTRAYELTQHFQDYADTDLTPGQISALARTYKDIGPSQIVTAYVPAVEQRLHGVWYLIPDEEKKDDLVDWLLKGNADAVIPLVSVDVADGAGDPEAVKAVSSRLRSAGFQVSMTGPADRSDYAHTTVIDYDKLKGVGAVVASHLGLNTAPLVRPNPHAAGQVEVIVGRDAVNSVATASRPD